MNASELPRALPENNLVGLIGTCVPSRINHEKWSQ
jgi:hypothetical protein